MNNTLPIGDQAKTARDSQGVKQSWVAKQMGISGTYLSDLEHNRRDWSQKLLDAFNKAVGSNIQLNQEKEKTNAEN